MMKLEWFLSGMVLLTSCGSFEDADVLEFQKNSSQEEKSLESIKIPMFGGVKYKLVSRDIAVSSAKNQTSYNVFFEDLSSVDFELLKDKFWKENPLEYEKRAYYFSEFLPPAMQAIGEHQFLTQKKWLPSGFLSKEGRVSTSKAEIYLLRPEIKSLSNCWTTAYELLRKRKDSFLHFFASDKDVLQFIGGKKGDDSHTDTPYSSFIKELTWKEACYPSSREASCPENSFEKRSQDLKFGDLLLIFSGPQELQHAAIALGDDLYFEKSGIAGEYLYRIVHYSQIRKIYHQNNFKYIYRRFEGRENLPAPEKVFGRYDSEEKDLDQKIPLSYQEKVRPAHLVVEKNARDLSLYAYTEVPFVFEKGERKHFSLSKEAFSVDFFFPSFMERK